MAENEALKSGDIVGQAGVEKVQYAAWRGWRQARRVNSVDARSTLDEDEPTEGKRLQLTIDYDAESDRGGVASAQFNGAAVVLDPNDGGTGFTSRRPTIRTPSHRASTAKRDDVEQRRPRPLQDRAT